MKSSKCNAVVGAETVLSIAGQQTITFHGVHYKAENENMPNFGPINPNGTPFAPKQWLM